MAGSERTETGTPTTAASTPAAAASTPSDAATENRRGDSPSGAPAAGLDGFRVDCLMNARYHSAREAFLDSVHRWLMLGVILFGSAAVLNLFGYEILGNYGAFLKALFAAMPVVFGTLDLTFDL